jgi:dienelactone hydrolase
LPAVAERYRQLGPYSDLVAAAARAHGLFPQGASPSAVRTGLRALLAFGDGLPTPLEVRSGRRWQADGVAGEEVGWSVGYGPRTAAWVLRPAGSTGPLPGVLALHDHGNFKLLGKEKIADGPGPPTAEIVALRERAYGGRAFANALARAGFVVLVHDVLAWGSRGLPAATLPETERRLAPALAPLIGRPGTSAASALYNAGAALQEHLLAKYCTILGTSMAALICHEDRIAAAYLRSRDDVMGRRIGCIGLSGGGCRAALLLASDDSVAAAAIVCMMSTWDALLDRHVAPHSWMFFPPGLARVADWPELAACRVPAPLLVQYALADELFTVDGMRAADARIGAVYERAGAAGRYRGEFYPGPHRFDRAMQRAAFDWLHDHLAEEAEG